MPKQRGLFFLTESWSGPEGGLFLDSEWSEEEDWDDEEDAGEIDEDKSDLFRAGEMMQARSIFFGERMQARGDSVVRPECAG